MDTRGATRGLFYVGVMQPMWASYIVKAYAWTMILSRGGVIDWVADRHGLRGLLDWMLTLPYIGGTTLSTSNLGRFLVFTYAWHLSRSQNAAARLLLGMSAHCARLIAVCTLRQIHDLAENHPEWLQPRWPTRPAFWRELLTSANAGDSGGMDQARMRGLQLMAAEQRALLGL